jgi:APA family basic amino acid/polyamine antiporter
LIDTKICYILGGSFAYLRVELGDFVAFIAAGNILLEYVIGGAAVARSWTSYFANLCNQSENVFRITAHPLPDDYKYLDPIAVGVIAVICVTASSPSSAPRHLPASITSPQLFISPSSSSSLLPALQKPMRRTTRRLPPSVLEASFKLLPFYSSHMLDLMPFQVSTMAEETKNPA